MSDTQTKDTALPNPHQTMTRFEAKHALVRLITTLKGFKDIRWRGRPISDSAVVSASWLWMADLPPDEIAEVMRHYLARLSAIVDGEDVESGLPPGAHLTQADAGKTARAATQKATKPAHIAKAEAKRAARGKPKPPT